MFLNERRLAATRELENGLPSAYAPSGVDHASRARCKASAARSKFGLVDVDTTGHAASSEVFRAVAAQLRRLQARPERSGVEESRVLRFWRPLRIAFES